MTRWTVRHVEADAIRAVQEMATATGTTLGQALSAAIRHGAGPALKELENRSREFDLVEAVERIQELQQAFEEALCSLCDPMTGRIASTGGKKSFDR